MSNFAVAAQRQKSLMNQAFRNETRVEILDSPVFLFNTPTLIHLEQVPTFEPVACGGDSSILGSCRAFYLFAKSRMIFNSTMRFPLTEPCNIRDPRHLKIL